MLPAIRSTDRLPRGCSQDYIEARHPIAAYDRRHVGPFPTPLSQLKNSPCFSFGERPVPRRAFQDTPGPNHYSNVCSALDKLSKAHFSPAFSIRGRLPVSVRTPVSGTTCCMAHTYTATLCRVRRGTWIACVSLALAQTLGCRTPL